MNERADVIMGGGGMPGSINQRPYPFGAFGRGAFRDASTILVALGSAGGAVHAWRPRVDPDGQALELVDGRGFNAIAGGGGRFAALEVPPPPGVPVLFGSLGDLPNAGAADVAADGTIAYKTRYHDNLGITIVDPAGVVVERPDAFPVDVQALTGGRAVWRGGAHGRPSLRPTLEDAMNIRVAEQVVAGVDVIAYWSNAASALVVESDGTGLGYMFRTQNGFDHDVVSFNGEAILAASRTAGEGPADLVKVAISSAGLRYLVPADGQAPPWFPRPTFGPITLDPPIDPPKPIAVTITSTPASGPVPLTVLAIATITNGPATSIAWRWRPRADPDWRIAVVNPGGDPDHHFRFDAPGEYEITAAVENASGRATSEIERVTATKADPPKPPASLYYSAKEYVMSTAEEIGAIKIADRFARIVLAGEGRGPFGWYEVLFDRTTPDDDCWFTLSKPDSRHSLIHTKIPVLLGADQKEAEDPFFYGKPTSLPNARGILESPVVIKDPASNLIVVYWTWPDRHPSGGTSSPSATWIKRAA